MLKKYNSLSRKQPLDSVQDTVFPKSFLKNISSSDVLSLKLIFYNATNMCAV